MSNVHRIMWFDQEIRHQNYPNCKILAEHFEISLRQANRDIEYLKSTLNAPLKYIAAKRGFKYEDITFVLPSLIITANEKKALSFLAYKYGNYDATINNQNISKLFRNLSEQTEPDERVPFFNLNDEYLSLFHKINKSICSNKKLYLTYADPINGLKDLVVHPYHIFGKVNNDFLAAYCEDYGDICTFRLERIMKTEESDQQFIVRNDYKPETYNSFLKKKPFKAVLEIAAGNEFTSFMGRKVIQINNNVFEIEFYDTEQFIRDIMTSQVWKNIIAPHWLREKIKNQCVNMIKKIEQK